MTVEEQHAQRMSALGRANEVRFAKARLKERLASGEEDALGLLEQPPPCIAKVEVEEFLTWLPKVGKVRAKAIVRRAGAGSPFPVGPIPLRRLGPRTRARLAAEVLQTPAFR